MVYFHIGMFLLFQVIANLFFKWGSLAPQHYWWGFALGNAVGVTSIIFMLGMYRSMPVAAVIAVGTGGTFLLNQVVMYLVYREPLSPAAAATRLICQPLPCSKRITSPTRTCRRSRLSWTRPDVPFATFRSSASSLAYREMVNCGIPASFSTYSMSPRQSKPMKYFMYFR